MREQETERQGVREGKEERLGVGEGKERKWVRERGEAGGGGEIEEERKEVTEEERLEVRERRCRE